MTTCFFVSDLHGDTNKYELLAQEVIKRKPSFLFLGGDLLPHVRASDKSRDNTVNPFINDYIIPLFVRIQKQLGCNYPEVYLIAGNDDYKTDVKGFIEGNKRELWKYLNSERVKFGLYTIYGYSYVPPTPFRNKDWEKYDVDFTTLDGSISPNDGFRSNSDIYDNSLISSDLAQLAEGYDMTKAIFLFHSPPNNSSLDKIPGNKNIGSKAIADLISTKQPYVTLHGHAHESSRLSNEWHEVIGRTHTFSAAWDGEGLAIVIFRIDEPSDCQRQILTRS